MSVCEHINQLELAEERLVKDKELIIYETILSKSVCLDCGGLFQATKEINHIVAFCGELQLQRQSGCNGIIYADNLKWNDEIQEHICGKCFAETAKITIVLENTLCPCGKTHNKSVFKA